MSKNFMNKLKLYSVRSIAVVLCLGNFMVCSPKATNSQKLDSKSVAVTKNDANIVADKQSGSAEKESKAKEQAHDETKATCSGTKRTIGGKFCDALGVTLAYVLMIPFGFAVFVTNYVTNFLDELGRVLF